MKEKWLKDLGLDDDMDLLKKINETYDLGGLLEDELQEEKKEDKK